MSGGSGSQFQQTASRVNKKRAALVHCYFAAILFQQLDVRSAVSCSGTKKGRQLLGRSMQVEEWTTPVYMVSLSGLEAPAAWSLIHSRSS